MHHFEYYAPWQEKLADQLRRGSIREVRTEERDGLHHVLARYDTTDGRPVWDSLAFFSKPFMAEHAVKTVKRLSLLN